MIKSEVLTVCAVISRPASVKQNSKGESFVSFGVTLPINGRDGVSRELEISVTADGEKKDAVLLTKGKRVDIIGSLSIRKKEGKTYFNLRADGGVEITKSSEPDKLEGEMLFTGKIGPKGVITKDDKKGHPFQLFSAFSTDKDGERAEFIWVHFLNFSPVEGDFMTAGKYVDVKGDLQFGVFKEDISIECRVKEVKEAIFVNKQ